MATLQDFKIEFERFVYNLKAINTEFRTGYDKEGKQFVYPVKDDNKNLPQNIDTSKLEPIDFTWEEYNNFKDKNKVKQFYKLNLQGKSIKHKTLGKIRLLDSGLDETFRQNRSKNFYLLTKIDKIIENSEFDRTEPPKHIRKNDNICKFHILYAKIKIDSDDKDNKTKPKVQTLLINIAEDNQGKRYYYYKPVETIRVIS